MMRPFLPNFPHGQPPENGWGLVFQAVNSVTLAVVTGKILLDMLRDRKEARHKAKAEVENLGPLVRREIERALTQHDAAATGERRQERQR
jgi:hypothetical protein